MPIRPIDVRRKEFRNGFRGYDANQVDDFLDAVADEFERTYTENSRLREEVSSLRERLQQFEELEGSIRSALVHAEQAANDLRRTANWEADDVRKSAAREAELTIRDAQARAHQMLAESSARVERIQESYEALQEAKRGFTNDFRQLLKTYTEVMENMEISSAREIEASLRERLDTESIAVAREAATQPAEDDAATRRIEVEPWPGSSPEPSEEPSPEPSSDQIDSEIAELEATEPEMEPSTSYEEPATQSGTQDLGGPLAPQEEQTAAEEPQVEESRASEPTDETAPPAADEVDREEPTLAEERSSESFFDREGEARSSQEDEKDSRIFRASRFLRRRE
jgi:cell division initiation protein